MPAMLNPGFYITATTRAQISRKVSQDKPWKGTRFGVRIEIERTKLTFSRNPIAWRARFSGNWQEGHAPTVWDAVQEIQTAAARIAPAAIRLQGVH